MNRILLMFAFISFQSAFSQVSMENNKLVKDGVSYKFSKYEDVFQNEEAKTYFKKARTNKTVGEIFAYTGGFTLGFGLAQALQSKNKTINVNGQTVKVEKAKGAGTIIGVGVGLIGIGIPFAIAAGKNVKKALATENGETTAFQPYFKLESAGNGMALSYNF